MTSRKPIPTESAEQRVVIEWAKLCEGRWPELRWLFHVPNVRSNARQAAQLAREGVRAGVADLCLPVARGGYHGLFIEMKNARGSLRPTQREFLEFTGQQGYLAKMCKSADEAIELLDWYLNQPPTAHRADGKAVENAEAAADG